MPTPVTTARHCLASDAARALDDAVSVARRRSHAQTTSLHVVSALLSPPSSSAAQTPSSSSAASPSSSILRDALSRARSTAYSPRLQFKALELCFGVALDRLPSHGPSPPEEPPVSNSLMAAIKRSQANQRRNPDTFHLYQQQQQQQQSMSGFSGVKVELQQLILAILDDPVVSRVFGEAGFRSCDIKLAVLRPLPPPPSLLRFPRTATRCPPLFLCNFSPDGISSLPFTDGEENSRRIAEVLARKSGCRNPILVGAGAAEAAKEFARAVEQQSSTVIPPDIRGLKLISVENDVAGGSWDEKLAEEILRQAEMEPGVVVSVGDLKGLAENENADRPSGGDGDVVAKLTRLLEISGGRVHVLGWSATYETYLKMLSKYPSLDRDWDLQLLPISYVKSGSSAGWLPRPRRYTLINH